jgi:nucleotide-binding universal stress UspA family protein
MVPLDGSELAECVFPHLETIAKGCGVKNVILVRAVEPFYIPKYIDSDFYASVVSAISPKEVDAENKALAKKYLDGVVSRLNLNGAQIKTEVIMGKPAEVLADYAAKNKVDLIIIATHGRSGVSRWVWGSVADRILRSTCAAVFMVRAPGCVPGIK